MMIFTLARRELRSLFLSPLAWAILAIVQFILAYLFTIMFSLVAIFSEELTYHQYKKKGTGFKLILTVLIEPFTLHPLILYAALKGNFDYFFNKKKKWGIMTRKGMTKTATS